MCKGVAGLLFGHKYKTVITKSAASLPPTLTGVRGFEVVEFVEAFRNETFHAIFCQRCGETLTKEDMQ